MSPFNWNKFSGFINSLNLITTCMELYNYIFISVAGLLLIILLHDVFQRKHTILRIFPIVGHLRYLLEKIGPELRQYWVANDKEEMPFTRSERSWIYATSKKENNNFIDIKFTILICNAEFT